MDVETHASENMNISTGWWSSGMLVNGEGDNVSFLEAKGLLTQRAIGHKE